jgi:hypothetical protein
VVVDSFFSVLSPISIQANVFVGAAVVCNRAHHPAIYGQLIQRQHVFEELNIGLFIDFCCLSIVFIKIVKTIFLFNVDHRAAGKKNLL